MVRLGALFNGCLFITGDIFYLRHRQIAANYPRICTVAVLRMDVDIRFVPHEYHQMQLQGYKFSQSKASILHTEHQLWYTSEVQIGDFPRIHVLHNEGLNLSKWNLLKRAAHY
jgi:hypothetical protein